jgi:hypothetical protein
MEILAKNGNSNNNETCYDCLPISILCSQHKENPHYCFSIIIVKSLFKMYISQANNVTAEILVTMETYGNESVWLMGNKH